MTQEINAQYDTVYETTPDTNNLIVTIQPGSIGPDTIAARLLLDVGEREINNVEAFEGELVMEERNTLKNMDYEIDDDGNLIIHTPDANNYSLDENGYLIYTYR